MELERHERFEELCALASRGEVDEVEWRALKEHLDICPACQTAFGDFGVVHSRYLPFAPGFEIDQDGEQDDRLKHSVLRVLARDGARLSERLDPPSKNQATEIEQGYAAGPAHGQPQRWRIGAAVFLIFATATLAIGVWLGRTEKTRAPAFNAKVLPTASQNITSVIDETDARRRKQEILEQEIAALKAEKTHLQQGLQRYQMQNYGLQAKRTEMRDQLDALNAGLDKTRILQAKAEQELEVIKTQRQNDEIEVAARNREIVSLNKKLEEKSAETEQDQDILAAEKKLRELIGARNLRIVDVYDGDDGATKAVGRVFYTEGKSLVFYAYDLSADPSQGGKYAYYVWGHREGDERTVHNLGTLDADDPAGGRWMLKVDDARALASIDRVFVTLEPLTKIPSHPDGKKLLSARLATR